MAIFGVGTDIVKLERIERSFERHGDKFVERILSQQEIDLYHQKNTEAAKIAYLAKRFAAKEAISKALGTGMRRGIDFKQLIVQNDGLGKPQVSLIDKAHEWAEQHQILSVHLSISDERDVVLAFAIAEIE